MSLQYDYSEWPRNDDKDNDEDGGGSSGVYERGLFPLTLPSEVWNGAFPSSSPVHGGWQTAQVVPPRPRTLDAAACSPYATLDRSLLVVHYSGKANHSFDIGTVLADGPIPKDVTVFYFEATFSPPPNRGGGTPNQTRENDNCDDQMGRSESDNEIDNNQGEWSAVRRGSESGAERHTTRMQEQDDEDTTYDSIRGCIGLVGDHFPLDRSPGTRVGSIGLRCIDGKIQQKPGKDALEYAPPINSGDTVGCGMIINSQKIFFTHNGARLPFVTLKRIMSRTHKLYPAVAVHGPGESIRINFGQKPFKFDLRNFEEEEFNREKRRVSEIRINETLAQQFVEDYLLHQGYEKTLYSLRNAKKETWLRESVMDTTSSSPVDLISIPMETETEQHSSMLNKYDEVNVGDISEMQAEYMDEDWTPGLPAASSDQCGVELERNDSNSRNDDVDEEKKTQDKDVESIPVSTMLLKGTSMELFQKHLHVRSSVRWHLLSGDVAKAMNILKSEVPVLEQKPHIWGALECQEFVEMIRDRDFVSAVHYARKHLAPNMVVSLPSPITSDSIGDNISAGSSPRGNKRPMGISDCQQRRAGPRINGLPLFRPQKHVNVFHHRRNPQQNLKSRSQRQNVPTAAEVVGLLAYKNVDSSPLSYLLSQKRRQNIACIANEVMVESFVRFLPTHELCTFGGLELLAAHYVVTEELLHEEAGGQGKSFVLEDCMGMNITPN